jgi:hypothetical protein
MAHLIEINHKALKMKNIYLKSIMLKTGLVLVLLALFTTSCQKNLLDKQPLSSISDATFWKTAADATLALNGVYDTGAGFTGYNFWCGTSLVNLDLMAGDGSEKESIPDNFTNGTLNSSYSYVGAYYSQAYAQIAKCNNFLDHIGAITMDATAKNIMIGEVRTIRAYDYFNLALYFGDVPLVQHLLTVDQANSVTRTAKADVWAFCESELKAASAVLPASVPDAQNGHMTAAAALAILGRLQMAEKKWTDAAVSYKAIMDFNYYIIDPRYRELFLNAGELSHENIMAMQYIKDTYNHSLFQYLTPETWSGWHQYSPFNELVKDFECTDGKTIDQSPLYDKNNPYNNRDPRLDLTVMISDRTVFRGKTYSAKPGTNLPDRLDEYPGIWSGYAIYKFLEEDPTLGSVSNDGNNFTIIRYAEVLLSYLESELEAGVPINQTLLDATINKVRGRAAINMPPVTTTDPTALRTIIRRERHIEFAFEGLRYYDCLRWGIIGTENNKQFTGMKLTNTPATYTAFPVDADGYYIYKKRSFVIGKNELWPIPQSERDLNKNLTQNPGY